jgi:hypothetical protein
MVWVDSPAAALAAIGMLKAAQGQLLGHQDQLGGQLRDHQGQLLGQLGGQLWDQLRGQLRGQLRDQLRDQLWGQLWDQLRGQLWDQLWDQLRDQLRDQLKMCCWGQYEAHWVAYYTVPRDVGLVTYPADVSRHLDLWATIARSTGPWWPSEHTVILCERPAVIRSETTSTAWQLHCPDGPAVSYPDGWSLYAWHGTRVPADLIEQGWDAQRILTEPNAEIRRAAIEHLGWDRFVRDAGLQEVASAPDPGNPGQVLTLYDVPEAIYDEPVRVLLCTNGSTERDGTRRRYGLTVPADLVDPVAAAAWTVDWPVQAYRDLEVRR